MTTNTKRNVLLDSFDNVVVDTSYAAITNDAQPICAFDFSRYVLYFRFL